MGKVREQSTPASVVACVEHAAGEKASRRSTLRNADTQAVKKSSASVSLKSQRAIASVSSAVGTLSSRPTTSTPTSFALFLSGQLFACQPFARLASSEPRLSR
jgi:hypothetical protein